MFGFQDKNNQICGSCTCEGWHQMGQNMKWKMLHEEAGSRGYDCRKEWVLSLRLKKKQRKLGIAIYVFFWDGKAQSPEQIQCHSVARPTVQKGSNAPTRSKRSRNASVSVRFNPPENHRWEWIIIEFACGPMFRHAYVYKMSHKRRNKSVIEILQRRVLSQQVLFWFVKCKCKNLLIQMQMRWLHSLPPVLPVQCQCLVWILPEVIGTAIWNVSNNVSWAGQCGAHTEHAKLAVSKRLVWHTVPLSQGSCLATKPW